MPTFGLRELGDEIHCHCMPAIRRYCQRLQQPRRLSVAGLVPLTPVTRPNILLHVTTDSGPPVQTRDSSACLRYSYVATVRCIMHLSEKLCTQIICIWDNHLIALKPEVITMLQLLYICRHREPRILTVPVNEQSASGGLNRFD